MSRSWSHFKEYRCANDCRQAGCPGHRMRIVYVHTSDHVIVQIDPKDDDPRAYDHGKDHIFDSEEWATMVALQHEMEAKWVAEEAERLRAKGLAKYIDETL